MSSKHEGMNSAARALSDSTGVRLVLADSGELPKTACHSREKSSPPEVGALRISFRSLRSSFSVSSASKSSDKRSTAPEDRKQQILERKVWLVIPY